MIIYNRFLIRIEKVPIFAFSIFIFVQIAGCWIAENGGAEGLDMRLRLKPGQRYRVRLISELNRTGTTEEGKREHESYKYDKGIGFEVKKVDTNGAASVEVTFQTLKVKEVSTYGYNMEYDSTKQKIAEDYLNMPMLRAAGLGESFLVKISPKGEIIEVRGLEEMCLRVIDKVDEWDQKYLRMKLVPCGSEEGETENCIIMDWEKMRPDTKKVWREVRSHNIKEATYSEKEIRDMLSDMIMVLPDRPLVIGDSWTSKVKIWGKNEEIDGKYTLKDVKKGTVIVDVSAKRTAEEEPFSWVNNEGREVGFQIIGSYEGSFEIDQATCRLVRSKVKSQFTGELLDEEASDEMTQPILEEEVITVEIAG